jgi:hypothetical protein
MTFVWPADFDRDDLEGFVVTMQSLVRRRQTIAVVNDLLRVRAPTAVERRRITDAVKEVEDLFRVHVVAWSDVLDSALIRGIITAIRWVNPAVYPHMVHGSIGAAEKWCQAQLSGAGGG